MSFFCLLWVPLLYLFRRSVASSTGGGYLWALLLGFVAVAVQHLVGYLVPPGEFGLSRWLGGFFDIVSLPALVPLVACSVLIRLRYLPDSMDYADFALLYLIPLGAYHSVSWGTPAFPEYLVVVPLLWTAQAAGISYFINLMKKDSRKPVIAVLGLGAALLPFAAATSWWAFYSHRPFTGLLLLFASLAPATVSVLLDFLRYGKGDRSKIWN